MRANQLELVWSLCQPVLRQSLTSELRETRSTSRRRYIDPARLTASDRPETAFPRRPQRAGRRKDRSVVNESPDRPAPRTGTMRQECPAMGSRDSCYQRYPTERRFESSKNTAKNLKIGSLPLAACRLLLYCCHAARTHNTTFAIWVETPYRCSVYCACSSCRNAFRHTRTPARRSLPRRLRSLPNVPHGCADCGRTTRDHPDSDFFSS